MGNCTPGAAYRKRVTEEQTDGRKHRPTIETRPDDVPEPLHSPIPDAQGLLLTASSIFIFPQLDDEKEEQWKVFNELDNRDEADMLALASFFQTVCATAKERESLFPEPNESIIPSATVNMDSIKVLNVGRIDSNLYDLDDYQIPPKGKITMDTALDIIDCYRRGGKLHVSSVQRILKGVYWLLKKFPNMREVKLNTPEENLVVCGDIHGQFFDLLYVLDVNGPPSPTNLYLFNGDFVDRGPNSVEVILTLFALQLAAPEHVFLNRGNHEDPQVCCIFGFMRECLEKYDDMTFSMFIEVFRYLPLATTINSQVLVLHGGLFGEAGVLLDELQMANRKDYGFNPDELEAEAAAAGGSSPTYDSPKNMDSQEMKEYLTQVVKDLMWSDPTPKEGVYPNPRGEGVLFGPNITYDFLRENNLRMLVRSHECVPLGYQQPYEQKNYKEILCTIFSASNYSQSGNQGAFMKFSRQSREGSYEVHPLYRPNTPVLEPIDNDTADHKLYYTVHCYYMGDLIGQEKCLERSLQASLVSVVLKRRESLFKAFAELDPEGSGVVSIDDWAEVMRSTTKLQVRWELLRSILVHEDCMADMPPSASEEASGGGGGGLGIKYEPFLNTFQVEYGKNAEQQGTTGRVFDALYVNKKQLEAIFAFYDRDGNGSISREEFRVGCETINQLLPPEEQIQDVDRLLDLLDFDRSDSIEINEFLEAFRLLDIRDGKLDGHIAISTEEHRKKAYQLALRRRASSKLFRDRTGTGSTFSQSPDDHRGQYSSMTRSSSRRDLPPLGA